MKKTNYKSGLLVILAMAILSCSDKKNNNENSETVLLSGITVDLTEASYPIEITAPDSVDLRRGSSSNEICWLSLAKEETGYCLYINKNEEEIQEEIKDIKSNQRSGLKIIESSANHIIFSGYEESDQLGYITYKKVGNDVFYSSNYFLDDSLNNVKTFIKIINSLSAPSSKSSYKWDMFGHVVKK